MADESTEDTRRADAPQVALTKLLMRHVASGSVDPKAGVWGFSHLYAEGIFNAE